MGKKRSKSSKQKQAKVKQQRNKLASALGGVSISKGITSKFQKSTKSPPIVVPPNNNVTNRPSLRKKVFVSPPPKAPAVSFKWNHPQPPTKQHANTNNDEQADFRKQLESLQERQWAVDNRPRVKKKNKNKNKQHMAASFAMQPASFSTRGKTTQELLNDAMLRISALGREDEDDDDSKATTPLPTFEGIHSTSTQPTIPTYQKEAPMDASRDNRFAALQQQQHEDDSDDDDNDEKAPSIWGVRVKAPAFPLAPASFTVLPRTTPTPATTPCKADEYDYEIDPDL